MLAAILAAAIAGPVPAGPNIQINTGEWVLVTVKRVIAPENMPGQCFVAAQVDRVVHGQRYKPGQPVYISLACRTGGMTPAAMPLNSAPPPRTIQSLRETKRALVHLDASSGVVDNPFYGVGLQPLEVG